jgi:pyruvate-formate lyase-activating enzyme
MCVTLHQDRLKNPLKYIGFFKTRVFVFADGSTQSCCYCMNIASAPLLSPPRMQWTTLTQAKKIAWIGDILEWLRCLVSP